MTSCRSCRAVLILYLLECPPQPTNSGVFPMTRALSLIICLLLCACESDGPLPFMSGGELGGTVAPVPGVWQFDENSALAVLETRPENPYSVNFTYVQLDGRFYVYAGDTRTNWVEHIESNPLVRVRVNGIIYPVLAERVEDPEEITAFAAVWASRSIFSRDPRELEEVWLYRLKAR